MQNTTSVFGTDVKDMGAHVNWIGGAQFVYVVLVTRPAVELEILLCDDCGLYGIEGNICRKDMESRWNNVESWKKE